MPLAAVSGAVPTIGPQTVIRVLLPASWSFLFDSRRMMRLEWMTTLAPSVINAKLPST